MSQHRINLSIAVNGRRLARALHRGRGMGIRMLGALGAWRLYKVFVSC